MNTMSTEQVVILGGGPIGLAAAAHLSIQNIPFTILEKGSRVGAAMLEWGHVQLFSPWSYVVDDKARELLVSTDWQEPDCDAYPTGREVVEQYLNHLAALPAIGSHLITGAEVVSVSRKGLDKMKTVGRTRAPFIIHYMKDGELQSVTGNSVIDATGTWSSPNPARSSQAWLPDEQALGDRITYRIPNHSFDADLYKGKHVAVIGSGHSAIQSLLELTQIDTERITWIIRRVSTRSIVGGGKKDQLSKRGELGLLAQELIDSGRVDVVSKFKVDQIKSDPDGTLEILSDEGQTVEGVDYVVANTGFRPSLDFLKEIRLDLDPTTESPTQLAPLIDPNIHSCGTVRPHGESILRQPEESFYLVGMKSYGRAPTFLLLTGYEQVRSIVAHLAGDEESAAKVSLVLPETGVCSTNRTPVAVASSCCSS